MDSVGKNSKRTMLMAINPKIKKAFPDNLKFLQKQGCRLSLDGTGMAYVVVDKTGYMISGPWSRKELAAHQAVKALTTE